MANETAHSKLLPQLHGQIIRWFNDEEFVILCGYREIIGHKKFWRISDGGIDLPHCAECNPGNGFAFFRKKV